LNKHLGWLFASFSGATERTQFDQELVGNQSNNAEAVATRSPTSQVMYGDDHIAGVALLT